jgi:hypothetical protein
VFPFVHLFKVRPERVDEDLQNLIIVACKLECLPVSNANPSIESLLDRRYAADFPLTVPALTDDLSPVDRYMSIAQASQ